MGGNGPTFPRRETGGRLKLKRVERSAGKSESKTSRLHAKRLNKRDCPCESRDQAFFLTNMCNVHSDYVKSGKSGDPSGTG